MKSKDLQKVVLHKYKDGDGPTKIFRDLNGSLGLNTIKRWYRMIRDAGSIQLLISPRVPRLRRTSRTIKKVKHKLHQNKIVSARRLAKEYGISKSSAHRILTEDLGIYAYKMSIKPKLREEQKTSEKNLLFGLVITFERRTQCASYFQTKRCLILTEYIIHKINDLVCQSR